MKTVDLQERKLSLTNDGQLSLFFIGVGSAFSKRHYQTNLLLIKGGDHLLIDCGMRCSYALYELGISITDIRNFLITHSHADHIGGLEEVALKGKYLIKQRPNMIINETYQHILWDMSMRGGIGFNENEAGDMLSFHHFWKPHRPVWLSDYPRETFGIEFGPFDLKLMRTMHIPDSSSNWQSAFWSCGVIIDNRVLYTCDTRFDWDLVMSFEEKFHFENIFHDCQFFTGGVHASLEELNTFPSEIKQKMYLVHYGDDWEKYEQKVQDYGFAGLTKQWVFYDFE